MTMDDWKVTVEEFECKCGCGQNGVDINFLRKLNEARDLINIPFIILSGFRCPEHNKAVGGALHSAHLKGLAADVLCKDSRSRYHMIKIFLDLGFHRIGVGRDFIHVDSDPNNDPQVIWLY